MDGGGGEPRGLRVSPVRIYRRERHGRHARDEGHHGSVGGGGANRHIGVRARQRVARVERKVRTSERREEKEPGGSK